MKVSDTSKDFERCDDNDHIELVLKDLERTTPEYFKMITETNIISSSSLSTNEMFIWDQIFTKGIEKYEKESKAYREFFDVASMEEFEEVDDPKIFKGELRNKCPIIRKSLMSRQEELQKWKEDFAAAKPQELLDTFANFLDFIWEYSDSTKEAEFNAFSKPEDYDDLGTLSDDPDLSLQSVIGAGIKSTVIYNIEPRYFCKSVRRTLYGLYFLTKDIHNRMPSRTSEFIIIDDTNSYKSKRGSDTNLRIEHNYWYPYNLFSLYTNHLFKILEKLAKDLKLSLSYEYRFVYVNTFLEQVCAEHQGAIKTMMGGDQDL